MYIREEGNLLESSLSYVDFAHFWGICAGERMPHIASFTTVWCHNEHATDFKVKCGAGIGSPRY